MKRTATVALTGLLATAACTDRSPVGPEPEGGESAMAESVASMSSLSEQSLDFGADLENITTVILPAFSDQDVAGAVASLLAELKASLDSDDRNGAAQAVTGVREAITPTVSNPTDLGYVAMVLSNIEVALTR